MLFALTILPGACTSWRAVAPEDDLLPGETFAQHRALPLLSAAH